jgi:hypothetical protein
MLSAEKKVAEVTAAAAAAAAEEILNFQGTCWEPITITVDSGAGNNVAPKNAFPWAKLEENEDSRRGRYYTTANGKRVYVLGQKTITVRTANGKMKRMTFQIADVTRILASVTKIAKAGNRVTMSKDENVIVDTKGEKIDMMIENGVYVVKCEVKVEGNASTFQRQAL